jgi:hypothetical protein
MDIFHGLFNFRINPEIGYFRNFAKKPLGFFETNPQFLILQLGPQN